MILKSFTRPMWQRAATIAAGVACLLGGGTALASIPSSDGTVTVCLKGKGEYFPDSAQCKKGWKPVTWSVQGPRGLHGPPGSAGASGTSVAKFAQVESVLNIPENFENVSTLALAEGRWAVQASFHGRVTDVDVGTGGPQLICELRSGAEVIGTGSLEAGPGQAVGGSISINGPANVAAGGGEVTVWCRNGASNGLDVSASGPGQVMAIKVDSF